MCIACGCWFTGGPRRPLRNALAERLCGACDLEATRALFSNDWEWDDDADMVDWWRELYESLLEEMGGVTIHLDGPCPMVSCLKTGPHDHESCPDCGAVDFGNPLCPTCKSEVGVTYRAARWNEYMEIVKSEGTR